MKDLFTMVDKGFKLQASVCLAVDHLSNELQADQMWLDEAG
jgi:hypothetical protein